MRAVAPTWELRAPCPCCGQGGLAFSTCPSCRRVVLICAEVGTVFPDPRDLSRMSPRGLEVTRCPSCGDQPLTEFRDASTDEIDALGFTPAQYR